MSLVELAGVGHVYEGHAGGVSALSDVELTVEEASSTAIIGRSGSGKSTLVSILALLRTPTCGSVRISGVETSRMRDSERSRIRGSHVGVVFQSFHLDPSATALENVMLAQHFQKELGRRDALARAEGVLELLEIRELAERLPREMSGGQRQRVAVARALLMQPALLIADEPTGNLDEDTATTVARCLYGLPAQLGTAVVVVTHDDEIARMADRRVLISGGRVSEVVV